MEKKIKMQKVSTWSIGVTCILAVLFAFVSIVGQKEFQVLETATDQYIACENAARKLQDGSDYLTEQVRRYVMTGEVQYMDLYFEEATITKRREKALDTLKRYFDKTETFGSLKAALSCSQELMNSEYYAMRLVAEATGMDKNTWPQEVAEVVLSETDSALGTEGKMKRAQQMVCDNTYQEARTEIEDSVTSCMDSLIEQTKNRQGRATSIFSDMYRKLEISIVLQVILTLVICLIVRKLVVRPLISYNENIKKGEIFPVVGASELQNLAETYNKIYQENQ